MKVINITPCRQDEFVDMCLSKGIINDILTEDIFIIIEIEGVEPVDYLYRRMFEQVFLRRSSYQKTLPPENGKLQLQISLSEAITFLNIIVPPVFRNRVKELYTSINGIVESLKTFLLEDPSDLGFNVSTFIKHVGLNQFETKSDYDTKTLKILRQRIPSDPIVHFMVYNKSFGDLYNGDVYGDELENSEGSLFREGTGCQVHCMINCIRKADLSVVCNILRDTEYYYGITKATVLNVIHSEAFGWCVELYIDEYDCGVCKTLQKLFKDTYKTLA